MTKAMIFSLMAMLFYAVEIVTTDLKLSSMNPRLTTFFYATGVGMLSGISLLLFPIKETDWPKGSSVWIFIGLMVAASFIAATAHFFALHEKSGAAVMTTYYALLPVTASALIFTFSSHELPSLRMVLAWILATIAIYLVTTDIKFNLLGS